jgi:cyclopropane-fatty-acyl-phospholipid synthase
MPAPVIDHVLEQVRLPEYVIRPLVRAAIAQRLRRELGFHEDRVGAFAAMCSAGPMTVETGAANIQHYEVPTRFFELTLGPRLKYSACLWSAEAHSLEAAEEAMLRLTCRRAGVTDGMTILELGCGWGSLALWLAERYPNARIVAVSNSAAQRTFIEQRAPRNVEVITADVAELDLPIGRFDRVISVEMLEHVRNHAALLEQIARWLKPDGRLFVHVFAHRSTGYVFGDTWMARRFFSGGVMPVHGWLGRIDSPLEVIEDWWLDGRHYGRTCAAWLERLEENAGEVRDVLAHYGRRQAVRHFRAWRMFFLACSEIFSYRRGEEYGISHVLMRPRTKVRSG